MLRKRKAWGVLAVAAAAAALAVVWPLVASGQTAKTLASRTFTDPSGDSGDGPDVTTVDVSDDGSRIGFTAAIANRPSLTDVDVKRTFSRKVLP